MIVNKLNGKCYVVITNSIKVRFYNYFNLAHLSAQKGKPVYNFITSLSTSIKIFSCGLISFTYIAGLQWQIRIYLNQDLLNYRFITGFTDAESLFIILITKTPNLK